jgi:hypothetical protein
LRAGSKVIPNLGLNLSCGRSPNAAADADRRAIVLTSVDRVEFSPRFLSSTGGRHNE